MVERELRASGPFGLEESPECARLRLANDAALGGSLELDPFDAHGKNRVSTTEPTLPHERAATAASGGTPLRLLSGDMGKDGDQLPQDMGQALAADMVSDPRRIPTPIFGQ